MAVQRLAVAEQIELEKFRQIKNGLRKEVNFQRKGKTWVLTG